jgi:hypothetical protein
MFYDLGSFLYVSYKLLCRAVDVCGGVGMPLILRAARECAATFAVRGM